jgi:hypothetical protein
LNLKADGIVPGDWFTVYALERGLEVTVPNHYAWRAETPSAGNDSKGPAP